MSKKSDYFFLNIKQIYPTFTKPSAIDTEIWTELLEPYSEEDIRNGIKAYRQNEDTGFAPTPARFKMYLFGKTASSGRRSFDDDLPLSPESYLMQNDIKAGRCKYFFMTYSNAVEYVLEEKLKTVVAPEEFKKYTRGMKYRQAVEYGLFADFEETLEYVYKKGNS